VDSHGAILKQGQAEYAIEIVTGGRPTTTLARHDFDTITVRKIHGDVIRKVAPFLHSQSDAGDFENGI
jgi:hypothetical protein